MDIYNVTKEARNNGYKVFVSEDGMCDDATDFFIITPRNNVMYAWYDRFCGWQICIEYVPSRANGSGCRDNTVETQHTITTEYLAKMEASNLQFARKLKAVLYEEPEEFIAKHWRPLSEVATNA